MSITEIYTFKVMQTMDYSLFKYRTLTNRGIDQANVRALWTSMKRNGISITGYILVVAVGDFYEILDGQHRFENFKTHNLPVIFVVIPEQSPSIEILEGVAEGEPTFKMGVLTSDQVIVAKNAAQKGWKNDNFLGHNSSKNPSVKFLLEVMKKYGYTSGFMKVVTGDVEGLVIDALTTANMRTGQIKFDMSEENVAALTGILEGLKAFKTEFPHKQLATINETFLKHYLDLRSHPNFDLEALMLTVRETPEIIRPTTGNIENRLVLTQAHNRHIKSAKLKIRVNPAHKGKNRDLMWE